MSYTSIPGQGRYHDTTLPRRQSPSSARHSSTNSYGPAVTYANGRQAQYATSAHDIQAQNHFDYAQGNQSAYGNDNGSNGWRDGTLKQDQYGYMSDSTNYVSQPATGNASYNNKSTTDRPNNISGLNSLAYASGLGSPQLPTLTPQAAGTSSVRPTSQKNPVNRMRSPLDGMLQQQQPPQPPQQQHHSTYPSGYQPQSPSIGASQQPSVAEALAGAVSRKNQQNAGRQQSQANQRSVSPYVSASGQTHGQSRQDQWRPSSPNVSKQRVPAAGTRYHQETITRQAPDGVQAASISNLVTAPPPATAELSAQDAMPAYIDPSHVFNPYQREHEKRRKDAAEAEARRAQEEAQCKEEEKKRADEEAQKRTAEATAAAEEAKTKQLQKKTQDKSAPKSKKKAATPAPTSAPAPAEATSPPGEIDMATQMKLMMDKMKEFRQQDPTMFQKLWDDMRKGGGNAVPGPTAPAVPAAGPAISHVPDPQVELLAETTASTALAQKQRVPTPGSSTTTSAGKTREKREPQRPAWLDPSVPLNGYHVVVENNEEGLPDLGRFPAERRVRGQYRREPGAKTERPPKASSPSGPLPTQPLPTKAADGGVEWPKNKREELAKSAMTAPKADPANAAIEITALDVNAMLDQNPNYIDLCDMLEKKGLKFHRGHFARQLLSSVLDLTKAQKQDQSPAVPTAAPQPTPQPVINYPPHPPPHPMPGPLHHLPASAPNMPGPTSGSPHGPMPPAYAMPPHGSVFLPPYVPPHFNPEVRRIPKRGPILFAKPEPPPGSKEAMARKRDFSELVDLTQLSDNEDYVLSTDRNQPGSPSPEPDLLSQFQFGGTSQRSQVGPSTAFLPGPQNMAHASMQPSGYPSTPPQPPKKPKTILARPVNKSEALAKEYYDPKTVARDIMIAAGRHPTERPLNAHMAGLLGTHIELDSDLNTFDWDAIDPGGPPAPKVAHVDIPAGPPRYRLGDKVHVKRRQGQGEHRHEDEATISQEESRLPYLAKRDPQDPPLASTPAPAPTTTSPTLSARLNHLNKPRKEDKSQSEPRPSRLRESLVHSSERTPNPNKRKASADPQDAPAPHASSASRPPSRSSAMETPGGHFWPSGKRKGRPPGSKNKSTALNAMRQSARTGSATPRVEVLVSSPSTTKTHSVYRCKWMRCKDELHNLETLRKHIRKKHHPTAEDLTQDKPFECWWKHCPTKGAEGNYHASHAYDNIDDWMKHMDETHVHEVAMKLGDGPSSTPADAQTLAAIKTRFLSDSKGRSVTPALSPDQNADLPADTWIITSLVTKKDRNGNNPNIPDNRDGDEGGAGGGGYGGMDVANGTEVDANVTALKAFLKTHRQRGERGVIGARAAAEETLRAMERRKRDVGVGLDRGGCTLVNEARRATFIQAPGIRMEVDEDY